MRLESIRQAYSRAAGRWRGCDWPTRLGPGKLNLQGMTSTEAAARAELAAPDEADDWQAAAVWLQEVEQAAEEAEMEAALALAAANAGDLCCALTHARKAAERETFAGRPRDEACWHDLAAAIENALQQPSAETRAEGQVANRSSLEREVARLQEEVRLLKARIERLEDAATLSSTY